MSAMKIHLFVGSQILTQGLHSILSAALPGVELSDSFTPSAACDPDIVLFDSQEGIEQLKSNWPDAKFICLDLGLTDTEIAGLLFFHGISGIISPQGDIPLLCKALRAVQQGELWVGRDYLKRAMLQSSLPEGKNIHALSEQDRHIIALIVAGRTNREIGAEICLSESTIKAHVSRIYRTLKVRNRAQLACFAAAGNSHPAP